MSVSLTSCAMELRGTPTDCFSPAAFNNFVTILDDEGRLEILRSNTPITAPSVPVYNPALAANLIQKLQLAAAATQRKITEDSRSNPTFQKELFEAITPLHDRAKQNAFLRSLTTGNFNPEMWKWHLVNLGIIHHVCDEKQSSLMGEIKDIFPPMIQRGEAVKKDIAAWDAAKDYKPLPKAQALHNYIAKLGQHNPEAFVGTMYVVYGTLLAQAHDLQPKIGAMFRNMRPDSAASGTEIFNFGRDDMHAVFITAINDLKPLKGPNAAAFRANVIEGATGTMRMFLEAVEELEASARANAI